MIDRALLTIIRIATCLILLVPLFVSRTTFFPYIFGKMIVFHILVEVSVCAWMLLMIRARQFLPQWRNPIVVTLSVFGAAVLLSTLFSVSPQASWWSSQERMTGVVSLLHLWVWFLMLHSCFRSHREWRTFLHITLFSSVLVGLYGIGQMLNFPFLMSNATGARLASTLGNPIYLGIYSLMHIFIAATIALGEKNRLAQLLLAGAGLFNGVILFLTYSRGVFFVLLISLIFVFIAGAFIAHRSIGKRSVAVICLAFVCATALLLWARTSGGQAWLENRTPPEFRRIIQKNIVDPDRVQLWNVGLRSFFDRPLLGWGNENFNLVYYKYTRPNENGANLQQAWFDRSHNQVIDILILYGLVGFGSYAIFWVVLISTLMRRVTRGVDLKQRFGYLLLSVFFGAYFVQNLSVFDSTVPLILFYFMLAFAAHRCSTNQADQAPVISSREPVQTHTMLHLTIQGGILMATAFLMYSINLVPLAKSKEGIQAIIAANQGRYRDADGLFRRSLDGASFTHQEVRRHLATAVLESISRIGAVTQQHQSLFNFAIDSLNRSISEQPYEIRNHLILSQLYRVNALADKGSFQSSIAVLNKALSFAPYRLDLYFELSNTYAALGDRAKAADLLHRADILKGK